MSNLNKKEKNITSDDKKEKSNTSDDTGLPNANTKKHGQCDNLITCHLWVYRISIVLCIVLLCMGVILIIIGNYANTGFFAIWAISNRPWPTINFDDLYSTGITVQFLQWSCWVSGFFCFIFVFSLAYVAFTYSKLMFSEEPWVWSKWNAVRKDANNWIRGSIKDKTDKEQWDMMHEKQQSELLRYNQEGMFSVEKANQKSQTKAKSESKV